MVASRSALTGTRRHRQDQHRAAGFCVVQLLHASAAPTPVAQVSSSVAEKYCSVSERKPEPRLNGSSAPLLIDKFRRLQSA